MTDDIVDRLRNGDARCGLGADFGYPCKPGECDECDFTREVADEIERLRAALDERATKAAFVSAFVGVTIVWAWRPAVTNTAAAARLVARHGMPPPTIVQ